MREFDIIPDRAAQVAQEARSFAEPKACAREEHARMLNIAAARRLRAFERACAHRDEDASQWKRFAPVALTKAASLRRDPEFPQLP
jgi:hypothetical protein